MLHSGLRNSGQFFFHLTSRYFLLLVFIFCINMIAGFNASTVICHRFTPANDLKNYCRNADIVISATGKIYHILQRHFGNFTPIFNGWFKFLGVPSLIRGHMIKEGAIVIDVGISRIIDPVSSKTKLIGDVHFEGMSHPSILNFGFQHFLYS